MTPPIDGHTPAARRRARGTVNVVELAAAEALSDHPRHHMAPDLTPAAFAHLLRSRRRRKPTDIPLIVIAVALGLALVFLAPTVQALESALATPDRSPTPLLPGEVSERLYRRVITIRDGLLALQPYRDPADTHQHRDQADAAGLTTWRRAAAIEAADIRAALHRRRHGMPLRRYPVDGDTVTQHDDLPSELRQPLDRVRTQGHEPVPAVALRELNLQRRLPGEQLIQRTGDPLIKLCRGNEGIQQRHVRWHPLAHRPRIPSPHRRQQRIRRRHRDHQSSLT